MAGGDVLVSKIESVVERRRRQELSDEAFRSELLEALGHPGYLIVEQNRGVFDLDALDTPLVMRLTIVPTAQADERSIAAGIPVSRVPIRILLGQKEYWKRVMRDLWINLRVARWIFLAIFVYLMLSTIALYFSENSTTGNVRSVWDSLYFTWGTMATVTNANPGSLWGRLVTSADVLVGLITIGVIVWLVTTALDQNKS